EVGDGCLDASVPTRLDGEVALGIEAKGAVGQVRRSNAGERIVNKTDFRMDEDRAGRHAVPYWVDEAQTAKPVTLLQTFHEPIAQHTHRLLFKPARARRWSDNEHLRPMRLLQAIAERGSDAPGGEILTFNVDVAPRGGDGVEIEGLDLAHFRTAGIGR